MKKKLLPWLIGILAATLFFAAIDGFTFFHYIGSDDMPILKSFMGYEGGVPANYNMLIHTFLAWVLCGLSLLFPGVAWFSVLQLFLLWFSAVVVVKSMAQCAQNHRLPCWLGAVAGLLFLGAFALFITCRISFTTTGALVGAAAVAQLLSIDHQKATNGQIIRGMLLSILLLTLCYSLRQISVLPPLAFCALGFVISFLRFYGFGKAPRRNAKPMVVSLAVLASVFVVLIGVREVEIRLNGTQEYLEWQAATGAVLDYADPPEPTPELLSALGWSESKYKLVSAWYFMDADITPESFRILESSIPSLQTPRGPMDALSTVQAFFAAEPAYVYACAALGVLALLCILSQLLRRKPTHLLWISALCGLGLGAVLLFYLGYQGRLPMRAAVSAIFPAAVFLFMTALACVEPGEGFRLSRLASSIVAGLACISLCVMSVCATLPRIEKTQVDLYNPDEVNHVADLEVLALENPEMFIITDTSLTGDMRLFPDTQNGIPGNIMFWGGWPARSPSWYRQLESFGIDGRQFSAKDFLRENVLVASTDGAPWDSLYAHISESSEMSVEWDFYTQYGYVSLFQFYEY